MHGQLNVISVSGNRAGDIKFSSKFPLFAGTLQRGFWAVHSRGNALSYMTWHPKLSKTLGMYSVVHFNNFSYIVTS